MGKFLFLFFLLGTVISNSNCKQNWSLLDSTDYDRLRQIQQQFSHVLIFQELGFAFVTYYLKCFPS